jgi:hypothetical protein
MFKAYLDESGHEHRDWMFVAGYLGHEDAWREKFVPRWKQGLGPQRRFLHMNSLRWGGRSSTRTKNLLDRLGPIPEGCGLIPVLGGVRYSDYEDLVDGSIHEKELKGYIACLFPLLIQVLRVVPDTERLEVVLEDQKQYKSAADQMLSTLASTRHDFFCTKDGRPKIAKWGWVPKGSTIMTDPADYLAFALRELWIDKNSKKTKWCNSILKPGEGIGRIQRRDEIRNVVTETYMQAYFSGAPEEFKLKFKKALIDGKFGI